MTDNGRPVYDSVRLAKGAYELRSYHPVTVRVLCINKQWFVVKNNKGKWEYNSSVPFKYKCLAVEAAKQLLQSIQQEPPRGNGGTGQKTQANPTDLSRNDALELLGFEKTAKPTKDEIKTRHRQLALKMHPDSGGSKAIMQLLNAAKELLE